MLPTVEAKKLPNLTAPQDAKAYLGTYVIPENQKLVKNMPNVAIQPLVILTEWCQLCCWGQNYSKYYSF